MVEILYLACFLTFFSRFCLVKKVCVPNPCLNKGKCVEDKSTTPCECAQGFTGKYCEGRYKMTKVTTFKLTYILGRLSLAFLPNIFYSHLPRFKGPSLKRHTVLRLLKYLYNQLLCRPLLGLIRPRNFRY